MPALADGKLELATPAYRLCAITINQLFQYIIFLPISIYSLSALFEAMEEEYDSDELTEFFLDWLTLPQTLTIICLTIMALIIFMGGSTNTVSYLLTAATEAGLISKWPYRPVKPACTLSV
ncbi:hypothetical protein BHC57_05895 [Snodgrassella alvi]|uniref:Uncharacterized protein n=1 Tax=Snodgrassella alvi TaxID=1196083 RepID=A0A855G7A8_9NEIS|nr:hypothetical protein BHC57_05895 [Snodgrassella alvi]